MSHRSLSVCALLLLTCACKGADEIPAAALELRVSDPKPDFDSPAVLHERSGRGKLRYLGVSLSDRTPARGDVVEVTHFFRVEAAASGDYDVFVHGEQPGSGERVLVADHSPVLGQVPIPKWKVGEIWSDPHRVKIPEDVAGPHVDLWVGVFKNNQRWTVEGPRGVSDGRDRIRAARLLLEGPAPKDDLPEVTIPRASGPITVDGRADEAAWKTAPKLRFADSMGRGTPVKYPTVLRLLYDDEFLYVFFDSRDADITERYSKRDDPIYDHETVELFIMPKVVAPEVGPYVELQASPGGIILDASFEGRRRGMNKGYDADQTIATRIDGTLNGPGEDTAWFSEWKVPWSGIRGATGAPKPGEEWRMNAFRIEKHDVGGKLQGEYTAWSPPKVGDFHNVARFGRMKFDGAPQAP